MSAPAWTCPECQTEYDPGFPWDLDRCEACEQERSSSAKGDES